MSKTAPLSGLAHSLMYERQQHAAELARTMPSAATATPAHAKAGFGQGSSPRPARSRTPTPRHQQVGLSRCHYGYRRYCYGIREALAASLRRQQLEYADMHLIHSRHGVVRD